MPDVEKVIKGLKEAFEVIVAHVPERYWGYSLNACKDALALLKAQEPRVMTLDEALGGDECWVEYSNGGCGYADCYLSYTTNGADIYRTMQHDFNVPLDTYGKSWRCWSSHPDEKRRAETPWE